jgi:hypothetical protein
VNRKEFIIFWANYVKSHKDEEWSKQQKKLIDSQIKSVRKFYKKNPEIANIVLKRLLR